MSVLVIKTSLWKQFGASMDMLENAILLIPDDQWKANKRPFYMAYHCVVFLDYYLTIPFKGFSPELPFTVTAEADLPVEALDDLVPNNIYTKNEVLGYLQSCREKCRKMIARLTEEGMEKKWIEKADQMGSPSTVNYSVFEILVYNMRHVQHHAAQLNLLLRQAINQSPRWVSSTKIDL